MEDRMAAAAFNQTSKARALRHSSAQVLLSCVFLSTRRKQFQCHVLSPQSMTRKVLTSELEIQLQKASSSKEREETKGRLWRISLFSTVTKAIREPPSIPLLSPLLGEWSSSVTVFRAAKASLLVVGELGFNHT